MRRSNPRLAEPDAPEVVIRLRVCERQSGTAQFDTGLLSLGKAEPNSVFPIGLKLPVTSLPPGAYRVEVTATNAAGTASKTRSADFELE